MKGWPKVTKNATFRLVGSLILPLTFTYTCSSVQSAVENSHATCAVWKVAFLKKGSRSDQTRPIIKPREKWTCYMETERKPRTSMPEADLRKLLENVNILYPGWWWWQQRWKVSRERGRWLWLKSNQYNNHYYNNHSVKVQTNNQFEVIKVENRNMIKFHKNIWNIWKMKIRTNMKMKIRKNMKMMIRMMIRREKWKSGRIWKWRSGRIWKWRSVEKNENQEEYENEDQEIKMKIKKNMKMKIRREKWNSGRNEEK